MTGSCKGPIDIYSKDDYLNRRKTYINSYKCKLEYEGTDVEHAWGQTHEECVQNIKALSVFNHIDLVSAYNSAQ